MVIAYVERVSSMARVPVPVSEFMWETGDGDRLRCLR